MKYYSTNHQSPDVSLREAVTKGLAPDKGLYMPERIKAMPDGFFERIDKLTLPEIALEVAAQLFGEDIPHADLQRIVLDAINFPAPVVRVGEDSPAIFSLELFHGPTLAFKDFGARFMARLLAYFLAGGDKKVTVLVATSGDTGSAVANGFLGVEGIEVVVLYPRGKVSEIQEKQFTTLGRNITAVEVDGTFDDCQRLVKAAFLDEELSKKLTLTSANSINVARFLPQSFYYFGAYAQLKAMDRAREVVFCVPSGNFGNLAAGLIAKRMGMPVERFIAANNRNDVFFNYLETGKYEPRPSVATVANAMDVGDPSNFVRILDLYGNDYQKVKVDISGARYDDAAIRKTVAETAVRKHYILDPHGACGYMALRESLKPGQTGVFLETAHPAKFLETVEPLAGKVEIPARLQAFMNGEKQSIPLTSDFAAFKAYLMGR